jgi:Holliday junction resolvase RusA-like endonuclease
VIRFVILGEPASKANSRVLSIVGPKDNPRTILRKGNKALSYERAALRQIPSDARQRLEGPVRVTLRIFYASERPDLDEGIVLDVLQDRWKRVDVGSGAADHRHLVQPGVYRNDRQVREKHVFHRIDRNNPRTEIEVEALQAQQPELELHGLTAEEIF